MLCAAGLGNGNTSNKSCVLLAWDTGTENSLWEGGAGFLGLGQQLRAGLNANQGCADTETKGLHFLPSFILSIHDSSRLSVVQG